MMRPLSALEGLLAHDMARAVAWLTEAVRNLEAYAEVRREMRAEAAPPDADRAHTDETLSP
jgi:hypothetical protein